VVGLSWSNIFLSFLIALAVTAVSHSFLLGVVAGFAFQALVKK
jgi:hypothetical protein